MDAREHGTRLKAAIARTDLGRKAIADVVGMSPRTVGYWVAGKHMPNDRQRYILRELLGPYDSEGDAVEISVRSSVLTEWRQDAVISFYKRNLHEQGVEQAG